MILQELKKIFDIKRVLIILIWGILFYVLIFQYNVGIPANTSDSIILDISLALKEKYGDTIDEIEYKVLLQDILNKVDNTKESKIDTFIKTNEEFKKNNITNYAQYHAMNDSFSLEVGATLSSLIINQFTPEEQHEAWITIFEEDYLNYLTKTYDREVLSNQSASYDTGLGEKAVNRIEERNQEEVYSLMPYGVMDNYLHILPDFAVFLFLSIILLIVPYSVKDTIENINILQYASKKGCKFYWKKVLSAFISAFILCVIEICFFILMLSKNHTFSFMDCYVSGFGNPFITAIKITFGQYIIISIAYNMIIGLCLAVITYCLSSCTRNYISAIAFQIPLIIFSFVISLKIMPHFAEITQNINILYMIPIICIIAAVSGNMARFVLIRFHERI